MKTMDFSYEQLYGTQEQKETIDPRYGISPRQFMQRLGTDGIRSVFGADVWWKLTLQKIYDSGPGLCVIEDVRFINEAGGIRDAKGEVWRLEPPTRSSNADPTHASEAQWSQCPYDRLVRPDVMGLDVLYSIIDQYARTW